ncbi:acyl dehydratase [Rhodococcus fascians]|uniref:MaoC/PaaZ C-terminal domain-containing protein n=1 Tax=Nocardiaceae TaxID=85025 RepID=UPI00050C32A1|nr:MULTISPECIES: MaoC/PaaZ C-terminal domain-containing protein [Rhodococcus]MDR6910753.1 acyl dehydratase [Rhodococcus sp. 3258]MDR6931880.1 acyl dehydratase [Rhodococcus fascians]
MTDVDASEWVGRELGSRDVTWDERDAILFALSVGARSDQLDLVFEKNLRVLPTFGLTLAQWAPDVLGAAGAFDVRTALHGSQRMSVHSPLPSSGGARLNARVSAVWDKGRAAVFDVSVECEYFTATWSIFAPGQGGFGGARGDSSPVLDRGVPDAVRPMPLAANSALLYRLSGDLHHIHVDPEAARGIGQPRPILHGLATLSTATLVLADIAGVHPCDLAELDGRFTSAVYPGETVDVLRWSDGAYVVQTERGVAIQGGRALFRAL